MGKSRGGLSTKIHAAVDALGNPVRFILTAGQHSEIKQANSLIEGFSADYVIADKGYDADAFIVSIKTRSGPQKLDNVRTLSQLCSHSLCMLIIHHIRRLFT